MSQFKGYYDDKNGIGYSQGMNNELSEKARLHQQQQPVKLQPAWEENNLPDDELNFRHLTMAEASLALHEPRDRNKFIYITFLVHGIGVLTSWNMFINAFEYFRFYKFSVEYIGFSFDYNSNFMQYLTFCSQIPAIVFSWVNVFLQLGGNITVRIVWSIGVAIVVFIVTILLAMLDTSEIPYAFFYVTLVCVVILNSANAIYQNTIFGMAAKLPGKYTGAIVIGNNICGLFASSVSSISKLSASNLKMAAIYYFITALFVLLICFDTYFALPLNKYYRHFDLKEKKEKQKALASSTGGRPPYWYIFRKALPQLLNVYLVFFVTLSIFPTIQTGITKSDPGFFVSEDFYSEIMCFMTFNLFALIGSWLPSYFIWPGPKWLWIPVVLRLVYIPLFLLCNYNVEGVDRVLPIVIQNDYVYFYLSATMALSSGYLSSLAMMYVPSAVEERYATTAGMFAAAALASGIFSGIVMTFGWPWFISHVGN
ncbi:unnamed protein product [Phyllotreta striolata]|uniref:Equilibrative nucleoside transporter 1 n=1 Tax=Phyllotreta striolata TaxID=444603 RepID=A0A9P0E1N0_PHYSR|nr:unnamed protein product [Phyllotreta striolata]